MIKHFTPFRRLIGYVILFCGLLIFLIWNQLLSHLDKYRQESIAVATNRNANLVAGLEQYTISIIQNADAVLKLVKLEYEQTGKVDFNTLVKREVIDVQKFNSLAILDEKGFLKVSNIDKKDKSSLSFSDREYFTFHINHPDGLFVSEPLFSRTINKTVVVLSRRINRKDGHFDGVVAVQIEPTTFTRFYANANLETNDIISLISPSGITYARRTGNKESFGESIIKSPLFAHVKQKPIDNYYAKDALHGIPTYFSYRKLENYPVIATVGAAESVVLLDYYKKKDHDYTFGIIITLLLILFAILICATLIHYKKADSQIKDSNARYRTIFDNSRDGIFLLSPNGCIAAINEAAYQLFKVDVDVSGEVAFEQLFQSAIPAINFEQLTANWDTKNEFQFTCLDNSSFIGEIALNSFQDSSFTKHLIINIRDITARKHMEQQLLEEQKRFQLQLTKQIIQAQEKEREAIGHELHDNVNQILTTVKLYLEMAYASPENRDTLLPRSITHVNECIHEIRDLSHALSSPTLGTRSLVDSVKALLESIESSTSLCISFNHEAYNKPIIIDQKLTIYRILQEQLTNIIKHAEATNVSVTISQTDAATEVSVIDDGKGFNMDALRQGIGLNNMLSRVKVWNGDMKVYSQVNDGCELWISLPIHAAKAVVSRKVGSEGS
ncbi:ATP-binding protein [Flavisolibacter tropicus]|uniref:histidine kinase n=1 Tax=Flavisolibacter tropicus TaxID=1492898 RepID=A0A172TX89_9BACT|nr:ATP-binding protein [Flavisolibacter tropicus]ANE51705.1 hypothetical protein SY85_15545 [Flavisolibacter tropicus]